MKKILYIRGRKDYFLEVVPEKKNKKVKIFLIAGSSKYAIDEVLPAINTAQPIAIQIFLT